VSRPDGTPATARSSIATRTYPRCDPGGPHLEIQQQGKIVRRLILTLLAAVCAVTALSGCGAPVASNSGTASVAAIGR